MYALIHNNNTILKYYYVKPTLAIMYVWLVIVSSTMNSDELIAGNFFHFGPGDRLFVTVPIDSWEKWSYIMVYSFFSQILYSLVNISISPFITNVIRDHKTEYVISCPCATFIVFSYKLYIWVHEILEIFLTLTLQLQYYLPAIFADILIGLVSTYIYIRKKRLECDI